MPISHYAPPNCRCSDLASILSAAVSSKHIAEIHANLITTNFLSYPYLHSLLVSLYADCGLLSSAIATLLSFPSAAALTGQDQHAASPAACTSVLSHLSRSPNPNDTILLFTQLRRLCLLPHSNPFTFSAILPACRSSSSSGSQIHSLSIKHGAAFNLFVSSALVDMYAKSSDMDNAKRVFDEMPCPNIVACNTLIVGYVHNRLFHKALLTFRELPHPAKPDQITMSGALSACAYSGEFNFGQTLHVLAVKSALDSLTYVKNSLINMYSKCGRPDDACKLFHNPSEKDAVTWNTIIAGCVEREDLEEALRLFLSMRRLCIEPDEATFSTVLHASATLSELLLGAEIHGQIMKLGLTERRCIGGSLITMYSKCGSLDAAQLVFAYAKHHLNVVSWTAMISAFHQHGQSLEALQLFDALLERGIEPESITFVSVLSACSHAGLVEKGFRWFASMTSDHGKIPGDEHYACMVDMLGRAGLVEEANRFIEDMPVKPSGSVWGALLGACRNCENLDLAVEIAYKLFQIEPRNSGNYVLLSNLYTACGKMKEAEEVRRLMSINGVKKEASCSREGEKRLLGW